MKRLFDLGVDYDFGVGGREPASGYVNREDAEAAASAKSGAGKKTTVSSKTPSQEQKKEIEKLNAKLLAQSGFKFANVPSEILAQQEQRFSELPFRGDREESLSAMKDAIGRLTDAPVKRDYTNAVAFLDSLQGTNVAKGLKTVQSAQEKDEMLAKLNKLMGDEQLADEKQFFDFAKLQQVEQKDESSKILLEQIKAMMNQAPSRQEIYHHSPPGGIPRPATIFEEGKQKIDLETFKETRAAAAAARKKLPLIMDARSKLNAIETGPYAGARVFGRPIQGLNPLADDKTKSAYLAANTAAERLSIKDMVETFQGMSRSIDTAPERMKWEGQVPSTSNPKHVNNELLWDYQSLAMKAEWEAKQQEAEYKLRGNLEGYDWSKFDSVDTFINPKTNQMVIAPVGQPPPGFVEREVYYESLRPGGSAIDQGPAQGSGPVEGQMMKNKKTGETRVFKNGKWEKVQ